MTDPQFETERERELWAATLAELHARHDDPRVEQGLDGLAERILAQHRAPTPIAKRASTRWVALAAVAAAAALVALVLADRSDDATPTNAPQQAGVENPTHATTPTPPERAPVRTVVPADPSALLTLARDRVEHTSAGEGAGPIEPGSSLGPGGRLTTTGTGETCLRWTAPFALVCIEGGAAIELLAAEPGTRRLRLDRGRLVAVLDPLAPGQRFEVTTGAGSVAAVGTVFVIEASEASVVASVFEGVVELREGERVRRLLADQAMTLGSPASAEPGPLDPARRERAEQVSARAELWREGVERMGRVALTSHDALALDGHPLGEGELALLLTSGEHALALAGLDTRTLVVEAGGEQQLGVVERRPATKPPADAPPSAAELARLAQQNRMARNYAETARLYRELLDRYPDSPETTNVGVRLGDLLRERGDHAGALEAYDRYLERGGQLAPDARSGRIKALRALGRASDEAAAIREFVREHADDFRVDELRTRLAELDG